MVRLDITKFRGEGEIIFAHNYLAMPHAIGLCESIHYGPAGGGGEPAAIGGAAGAAEGFFAPGGAAGVGVGTVAAAGAVGVAEAGIATFAVLAAVGLIRGVSWDVVCRGCGLV